MLFNGLDNNGCKYYLIIAVEDTWVKTCWQLNRSLGKPNGSLNMMVVLENFHIIKKIISVVSDLLKTVLEYILWHGF